MNIQTIINTLKNNNIKSKVVTTHFGYQMAEVKLNNIITFPHLLEIAIRELDHSVVVSNFGRIAMVYIPGSKA